MKIGINSRILQNGKGGIPLYVKYLYRELLEIDKENSYVFFPEKEKNIKHVKIAETFNKGQMGAFLFDNFLINNLVKKEKIDIFHGPSNILPILREKGIRYIVTVHDLAFLKVPQLSNFLYKRYYKLALGQSLKNADIIVVDSQSTMDDIIRFYRIPESKIEVVYLGVDSAFSKAGRKGRIIKGKYLFSVTTHPRRKNILGALKAFACSDYLSDFKYVIAGIIPEQHKKELNEAIKKLGLTGRVIVLGYVEKEDIISLYQNAEFFIYPCFYDGFSFPVLEAMVSKCPVIASNNSAFIELTLNKKWLVDPYNTEDIKDKMEKMTKMSNEEKNRLIENNYAFAKCFTWRRTALKMIDIFNSLN